MKILLKVIPIICIMVLALSIPACSTSPKFNYESNADLQKLLRKEAPDYPPTSFIVISDPHLYSLTLGTEGKAFQAYLAQDRKLLKESTEILESAIDSIKKMDARFVIVPGDLTKDGERVSHELAVSYLWQLEASGKKVYVVPGNHDIRNGESYRYTGDTTEHVPTITDAEFEQLYGEFGYKEALQRDPNSLSYLSEPQPGLWLLALDSCRYAENKENQESVTDGKFNVPTLQWIEQILAQAITRNKAVIAVMHHNLLEHYQSQQRNFGDYIVDDYQAISKLLAMYHVRLVFTGHYHAQDITAARWPEQNKFLFDIETGSLVTYPSPYRVVSIDIDQKATIRSYRVQATRTHPSDFPEYSQAYIAEAVKSIAIQVIQGYRVERAEAESLAQQVTEAFIAHYAGDEALAPGQQTLRTQGLSFMGWIVVNFRKDLVQGLWTDLEPADNNITIDLKTGRCE